VVHPPFTDTPRTESEHDEKEPEYEVFHGPRPSPELTDPELHLNHQSLSTDSPGPSPPVDFLAAIYAAKGKVNESRRISGTTRDVGDAAQMEFQPDGRLLDPGE